MWLRGELAIHLKFKNSSDWYALGYGDCTWRITQRQAAGGHLPSRMALAISLHVDVGSVACSVEICTAPLRTRLLLALRQSLRLQTAADPPNRRNGPALSQLHDYKSLRLGAARCPMLLPGRLRGNDCRVPSRHRPK